MQINGNKLDFGALVALLAFIFLFFIMFNPLAINIDSAEFWLTHLSFYDFTTPEAIIGIMFIIVLFFMLVVSSRVKDQKYKWYSIVLIPTRPFLRALQQSTQTINSAQDYNPLAWFGASGNLLITIGLVIFGFLVLLYLIGGRGKGGFLKGKIL